MKSIFRSYSCGVFVLRISRSDVSRARYAQGLVEALEGRDVEVAVLQGCAPALLGGGCHLLPVLVRTARRDMFAYKNYR
jgi:hypothetical protein